MYSTFWQEWIAFNIHLSASDGGPLYVIGARTRVEARLCLASLHALLVHRRTLGCEGGRYNRERAKRGESVTAEQDCGGAFYSGPCHFTWRGVQAAVGRLRKGHADRHREGRKVCCLVEERSRAQQADAERSERLSPKSWARRWEKF